MSLVCVPAAQAQESMTLESTQDKTGYHLFNPTPSEQMRPLSADRPDATESPITVDAGHVQVEVSFFDYIRSDHDGDEFDAWTVFDANVKFGLFNNVDLQLVFGVYGEQTTEPAGGPETSVEGFGDVQIRTKVNLWGNEGGTTAFGIMPFVKIPTDTELSNGEVEGGMIVMLGWDAGDTWGLGFQAEVDFVYDEAEDDHDTEFLHTVVLGFDVTEPLGAYVEYVGVVSSESDVDYRVLLSAGLTYALSPNVVLDTGTQIGLTGPADDLNLFAGVTWRF